MPIADKIKIERQIDADRLKQLGVRDWSVWDHEPAVFPWTYDASETCYLIEGDVTVLCEDGSSVYFGAGDLVTFPTGLACTWDIRRTVRKHYRFG